MKILFVQDHLKSGGAARAADRWARLLARACHNVRQVAGDEASATTLPLSGKPARGWGRVLEYFSERRLARKNKVNQQLGNMLQEEKYDLIWFHNLAGGAKWGWSEEMVMIARGYAPVLWTLHDMWALGDSSESYWEMESAVVGGKCKGAGRGKVEGGRGHGARVEGLKGSRVERVCGTVGNHPVKLTAPSQWLANLAKKVTGQECVFLPNPIDLETFSSGEQVAARRRWGLPEKGVVVLAGADSLADPRKGFDLLREAWASARGRGATLALFGRHGENRAGERYLGNLTSDDEMVAAYRAADLYVHPARMENAPCTIQESLACGTPVLAFAVGGIPEMIEPGRTGFLADKVSAESLQEALTLVLSNPAQLRGMREECRKAAEVVWRSEALAESFRKVVEGLSGR